MREFTPGGHGSSLRIRPHMLEFNPACVNSPQAGMAQALEKAEAAAAENRVLAANVADMQKVHFRVQVYSSIHHLIGQSTEHIPQSTA
jgi:hypothetical protein